MAESFDIVAPRSGGHHDRYARLLCQAARGANFNANATNAQPGRRVLNRGGWHVEYLDHHALRIPQTRVTSTSFATLHWGYFWGQEPMTLLGLARRRIELAHLQRLSRAGLHLITHGQWVSDKLASQGMASNFIPYPSNPAVTKRPWKPVPNRLGIFGGLRKDQRPETALLALTHLPGWTLRVVAGTLRRHDDLRSIARKLRVDDRVTFRLGPLPDEDLGVEMAQCQVVGLPYAPWFTGQSGFLVDALALGAPVAASPCPVVAETTEAFGGTLASDSTPESFAKAVLAAKPLEPKQKRRFGRTHSEESFKREMAQLYGEAHA